MVLVVAHTHVPIFQYMPNPNPNPALTSPAISRLRYRELSEQVIEPLLPSSKGSLYSLVTMSYTFTFRMFGQVSQQRIEDTEDDAAMQNALIDSICQFQTTDLQGMIISAGKVFEKSVDQYINFVMCQCRRRA